MTWRIDMEYGKIRNIMELKAARRRISKEIALKEQELKDGYSSLRSYLDPMTYVHRMLAGLYSVRHLLEGVRNMAEWVTGFFRKGKKTQSGHGPDEGTDMEPSSAVHADGGTADYGAEAISGTDEKGGTL